MKTNSCPGRWPGLLLPGVLFVLLCGCAGLSRPDPNAPDAPSAGATAAIQTLQVGATQTAQAGPSVVESAVPGDPMAVLVSFATQTALAGTPAVDSTVPDDPMAVLSSFATQTALAISPAEVPPAPPETPAQSDSLLLDPLGNYVLLIAGVLVLVGLIVVSILFDRARSK